METLDHIKTLGQLLRLAYEDMEKIKINNRYRFDVHLWHEITGEDEYEDRPRCSVCIAGAIMANTLGADPARCYTPREFGGRTRDLLDAIDCIRLGGESEIDKARSCLDDAGIVYSPTHLIELMDNANNDLLEAGDSAEWLKLVKEVEAKEKGNE